MAKKKTIQRAWIKITEGLPEKDFFCDSSQQVLVRCAFGIFMAYYDYSRKCWDSDFKFKEKEWEKRMHFASIEEWMPIPMF